MKNKFLLFACLAGVVVGLLSSCKKHTDLSALDSQIAGKSILSDPTGSAKVYSFVEVDKAAMNSRLHEWKLEEDSKGKTGYYRVATTGNGLDSDETLNLTWQTATMADDGLSMTIPVTVDGVQKTLVWSDGQLHVDGYAANWGLISVANTLRTVNEVFVDYDFVLNDTSSYITSRMDTTDYLAWKTEKVYYTQEEIDDYKLYLLEMADTLAWFNATYPNRAVPDTVLFSSKEETSGKYKGLYKGLIPVAYDAQDIKEIKTNHGPLHIVNGEMVFKRENKANTGSFYYREQTWTKECYTKPSSEKAQYTDSLVRVAEMKWTPTAFINVKKFDILIKGAKHSELIKAEGGVTKVDEKEDAPEAFIELPLSSFTKAEGTVTYANYKYKNKK